MALNKANYLLTKDAENDLVEIARYTLQNWGKAALLRYQKELTSSFHAIANGPALNRQPLPQLSDVHVTKSQKHFIFYILQNEVPVIIAVIHEQRDLVSQLMTRLTP
ncbi:type II toxin-antitoxin system RelE/ParE family toxin [Marinicella rhabdoformis]|uniref:type II toxin-antitoxin system RelE/ParE family toxin n=1 Tax=Marinicella rhabdoformis TaxID=2580566 RepID=UPI0012AEB80B|nr:type II toxin-antitoxin system RelE/ParE family toxin [Marinicella rhabdoformis]